MAPPRRSFLIVTTRDLPEAYALARFLLGRQQRVGIVSITGRRLGHQMRIVRKLLRNRGAGYVLDLALQRVLGSRQRRPAGARAFPGVDATLKAAIRRDSVVLDCLDPHAPATLSFVADFAADYILLAGAPILRPPFYELAREGALNRHLGLLPDYRGSDCPIWALARNDIERLGFTIHFVSERVDAGAIVLRQPMPPSVGCSFEDYVRRLQASASAAFMSVLDTAMAGGALPRQPPGRGGHYYPPAGFWTTRRARENYERAFVPAAPRLAEDAGGRV
jgi:folate-dependent phosphoribosylglycinamide formyltransferase PurN